jgi:hypothetical protein
VLGIKPGNLRGKLIMIMISRENFMAQLVRTFGFLYLVSVSRFRLYNLVTVCWIYKPKADKSEKHCDQEADLQTNEPYIYMGYSYFDTP